MTAVIFIFFITVALDFIIGTKLGVKDKLGQSKYKLLYKLAMCNFCFFFWVAALSTGIWYLVHDAFLVPFAVVGIWKLFNEFTVSNEQ